MECGGFGSVYREDSVANDSLTISIYLDVMPSGTYYITIESMKCR